MRYGEYVLYMLRKEREMEKQLNLFDHGMTTCAHCKKRIYLCDAKIVPFCTNRADAEEHFCGNDCHNSWHINRLNQMGL